MSDALKGPYPVIRALLFDAAWCLSDSDYQRQAWAVGGSKGSTPRLSFDDAINEIYDLIEAGDEPGVVLIDQDELALHQALVLALDRTLENSSPSSSYEDIVRVAHWPCVMTAARDLCGRMRQNDPSLAAPVVPPAVKSWRRKLVSAGGAVLEGMLEGFLQG